MTFFLTLLASYRAFLTTEMILCVERILRHIHAYADTHLTPIYVLKDESVQQGIYRLFYGIRLSVTRSYDVDMRSATLYIHIFGVDVMYIEGMLLLNVYRI